MQNNRMQSFDNEFYAPADLFAAAAAADERASFITKTYLYLFGAVAVIAGIETFLFTMFWNPMVALTAVMIRTPFTWLIVIGAFMVVSWIAETWARSSVSSAVQHAGLGLYIAGMSIILVPTLCLAQLKTGDTSLILSAGTATAGLFAMLTVAVFVTRKDFSFLRSTLVFASLAAMGLIATAIFFQFALGPIFMYAMIALACGYILYHTSNVLHHYRIGQHVAAALALFASVAMLFWYILQLFLSRND